MTEESIHTFEELCVMVQKTYRNPDLELLQRAYDVAKKAHQGEKRLTGADFVTHPLAVAFKLAEMGIHLNVVAAGLLHDTVEDSGITVEDLRAQFGEDIAGLVDGVTKLKKIKYRGVDRYSENMRKMFMAMASDVRVIFIKCADRLHNMQTLYAQPKHRQERIAKEVMEIYAPIAGRLGMNEFRGELEDLAFSYLQPKEHAQVQKIMEMKVREKGAYVSRIIDITEKLIRQFNIPVVQVHGRVKRLYSLWKKIKRHDNDISKIYDYIAVRVIVQDVEECYAVLGILHQKWKPIPGRLKDYIAQPKPNNYQSLHTTVFADNGEPMEFQIRTQEMHEVAEFGIAAHWRYKDPSVKPLQNLRWMEELGKLQKDLAGKHDFLEQLEMMKIDLFKNRIFVFTPHGDVIDLPEGASPIDFAYAIHTEVGNTCSGVKVNDRKRNMDCTLQSGDIVEVITDKTRRGPNADWLKFAKTAHARDKIREATRRSLKGWFTGMMRGNEDIENKKS